MRTNKRLTILSKAEQVALYALPDFNNSQRNEYLILSESEQSVAFSRPTISAQAYCILQIAYFKAKQIFFQFLWEDVPEEDIDFVSKNYFNNSPVKQMLITKHERYTQRAKIMTLFSYKLCSKNSSIFNL